MKKTLFIAMVGTAILLSGCGQSADKSTSSNFYPSTDSVSNISTTASFTSGNATTTDRQTTTTTTTKKPTTTILKPTITIATTTTTTTTTTTKPTTATITRPTFTTIKTTSATTTNVSPEYVEMMYKMDLDELNIAYSNYKEGIESDYMNFRIGFEMERDRLEMEIARLQGDCLSESIKYQRQLSELQKKKMEAESLSATNSYYKTLAQQYQSQINNLHSQINQIESNYENKINSIQQQIDKLPTKEELLIAEKNEYANLDAWYQEQLNNLNAHYGR